MTGKILQQSVLGSRDLRLLLRGGAHRVPQLILRVQSRLLLLKESCRVLSLLLLLLLSERLLDVRLLVETVNRLL